MNPVIDQLIVESDQIANEAYPTIDDRFFKAIKANDKEGMKHAIRDIQIANKRMAEINRMLKSAAKGE